MRKINRIFVHCTASYQETTTEKTLKAEFKNKDGNILDITTSSRQTGTLS